jgi:hypothetical protein
MGTRILHDINNALQAFYKIGKPIHLNHVCEPDERWARVPGVYSITDMSGTPVTQ